MVEQTKPNQAKAECRSHEVKTELCPRKPIELWPRTLTSPDASTIAVCNACLRRNLRGTKMPRPEARWFVVDHTSHSTVLPQQPSHVALRCEVTFVCGPQLLPLVASGCRRLGSASFSGSPKTVRHHGAQAFHSGSGSSGKLAICWCDAKSIRLRPSPRPVPDIVCPARPCQWLAYYSGVADETSFGRKILAATL